MLTGITSLLTSERLELGLKTVKTLKTVNHRSCEEQRPAELPSERGPHWDTPVLKTIIVQKIIFSYSNVELFEKKRYFYHKILFVMLKSYRHCSVEERQGPAAFKYLQENLDKLLITYCCVFRITMLLPQMKLL